MIEHKFFSLISGFSRKEMTRFRELAYSPYHHKHEDVRKLITYFSDVFPQFNATTCERKKLFQHLYPGQAHQQNRLSVLFTYAHQLCEQFLVLEHLKKEEWVSQSWLLQALRDRRQYKRYEQILGYTEKAITGTFLRDAQYFSHRLALAEEADRYFIQTEERRDDPNLQQKEYFLDHYYLTEKLRDGVELLVRSQILRVDYSARLLEAVLYEVGQNQEAYNDTPIILIYYRLYLLMRDRQNIDYQAVLKLFQSNESIFNQEEVLTIYNYLQNFCIAQINRNDTPYLRELFQLYQIQLDRNVLLEDGYLVEWHYKNIVTVALRLGELDWSHTFIETYREKLPPHAAANAYRFNLASYYHAAHKYERVLELLTQVEYVDLRYNLGAKALLLRTYYELDEYESLSALVDTFRQYLKRNRMMADMRRAGYYQLFRLTRRAASIRSQLEYTPNERNLKNLVRLRTDIDRTQAIFNRAWLDEKVTILEKIVKRKVMIS